MIFKEFESLKPVAESWDALLPFNHHLQSKDLLILEHSEIEDLQFRYLFIYAEAFERPAAVAYFQLVHFQSKHYDAPLFEQVILNFAERKMMKKGFHIIICGNLFRVDAPGIFWDSTVVSDAEVIKQLQHYFTSLKQKAHVIVLKDWPNSVGNGLMKKYDFHLWPDDLTMKMALLPEWKYFENYTTSLKHKYAQRVRKACKKFQNIKLVEFTLDEIIFYHDQIEGLFHQVVRHQLIRMIIPGSEYFIQMKKTLGDKFRVFAFFSNDELIAFSSHIVYDEVWEMHFLGMDYKKNKKYWIYFNLMYHAVEQAIGARKTSLELGRTAREVKAMMGGTPVYFISYVRIKGTLVNSIVSIFAKRFNKKAGNAWLSRNPYKTVESGSEI
ncbi:MAG: GNAT family N-acetyltransferase [Chitinophagales bacterium]|nr:GNAT family N-acetyltransferase [Chitinophagales bacterium]